MGIIPLLPKDKLQIYLGYKLATFKKITLQNKTSISMRANCQRLVWFENIKDLQHQAPKIRNQ